MQLEKCTDDSFSFIIGAVDFKCKNKQFTLAQYCVDKLFTEARQSQLFGTDYCKLMESASKIDVVFPNEYLMNRGKKKQNSLQAKQFKIKDEKINQTSLILDDEAIISMLIP
ncbi:UNKNOWN [Stylonychia lemnae]|uniref:Uncharacterized protein n=1 Tax=Stylonychia lemnae TaxID=5949 RepID=A0A077ZYG4_STYLE|nr:UNKNOWN [Stylonychia lemnae]|eukprot:CDW74657.1 UNKNOWN [Stylonychia lemnae]